MKTPAERGANGQNCRGFSFAEVMFAVVILGIGFILIAAIFPVAIQQSQATGEESNAAAIARQAAAAITTVASSTFTTMNPGGGPVSSLPGTAMNTYYNPTYKLGSGMDYESVKQVTLFPPTVKPYVQGTGYGLQLSNPGYVAGAPGAVVVPFAGSRWDLIKANAVLPNDPRFAYAAFYKRDNGSSAAELIVVAMAVRNKPIYDSSADVSATAVGGSGSYTLTPSDMQSVYATYSKTQAPQPPGPVQTIVCPDSVSGLPVAPSNLASYEASYVQTPAAAMNAPRGRTYTLGRCISSSQYELWPGDDMCLTVGSNGAWNSLGRIAEPAGSVSGSLYQPGTLQATVAYAQVAWLAGTPAGRIYLSSYPANGFQPQNPPPITSAAPGAFVIVADDYPGPVVQSSGSVDYPLPYNYPGVYSVGALNGRIFRLGKPTVADGNQGGQVYLPGTFDLDPQYGVRPPNSTTVESPDTIPSRYLLGNPAFSNVVAPTFGQGGGYAKVYIIGAGVDPSTGAVSGSAQDIGVFATYFQVQ
jgi:type II secretory pathway pseudopilin PulG